MYLIRSFFIVSFILSITACSNGPSNQSEQQALEIQNSLITSYDTLYQEVEAKYDAIKQEKSNLTSEELQAAYDSMLRGLEKAKVSLDQWKSNLTEVEGANDFKKGRTQLKSNDGISDADNLKIQQDMKTRFKEIKDQIEDLFATIDQYKQQNNA